MGRSTTSVAKGPVEAGTTLCSYGHNTESRIMDPIYCETCGKILSEKQLEKGRDAKRTVKYCSPACWGKRLREYNYDHTFLDTDSELSAYFMGWWTADGHIDKQGAGVSIVSVDKQLIDALVLGTKYNNIISAYCRKRKDNGGVYKIEYTLRYAGNVSKRIQEMGYPPGAKGGNEHFPQRFYNDKYFFHFLRGFIDGDGTNSIHKKGDLGVSMVNMSRGLLESIHAWLVSNKLIRGGYINEIRPNFYRLAYGHFDSVQICKRLYENHTICLQRKYKKYLAAKDFIQGCVPQTNAFCTVPGCDRPCKAKELCAEHYDSMYHKIYAETHREEIREKNRRYSEKNRDAINTRRRADYVENPEKYREQSQKWREDHPDKVLEAKRAYIEENREKVNEYKRNYRDKNHGKVIEQERASHCRNIEQRLATSRKYKAENKEKMDAYNVEYRKKTKEKRREYDRQRYLDKKSA